MNQVNINKLDKEQQNSMPVAIIGNINTCTTNCTSVSRPDLLVKAQQLLHSVAGKKKYDIVVILLSLALYRSLQNYDKENI